MPRPQEQHIHTRLPRSCWMVKAGGQEPASPGLIYCGGQREWAHGYCVPRPLQFEYALLHLRQVSSAPHLPIWSFFQCHLIVM